MADIEFVIEAPQVTRTNKKRPRLVTSCDHCRVKKIKCVQQPATGKCEACLAANLPCQYRDREQYFAERTRMLSGAGSALRDASSTASNKAQLSAINGATPTPSRGPTPPHASSSGRSSTSSDRSDSPPYLSSVNIGALDMNSFQMYSDALDGSMGRSAWSATMPPTSWTPPRQSPDLHPGHAHNYSGLTMAAPLNNFSPMLSLFDPSDSTQPEPTLMMHFVHDFSDKFGSTYPFLSSDSLYQRFVHRRLPALLANAVAASAAQFSTLPEITQIGSANAADLYCQIAKSLIPREGAAASLDTLHSLMLLAWVEYKRHKYTLFNGYARACTRIASQLGISEESLPQIVRVSNLQTGRMLQATWQGIQLLERTLLAAELVAFTGSQNALYSSQNPAPHVPSLW